MNSVFSKIFKKELFGKDYKNQDEYLFDLIKKAELIMVYFMKCVPTLQQYVNKFSSLVITEDEIKKVFEENCEFDDIREDVKREVAKADFFIRSRLKGPMEKNSSFFSLEYVRMIYRLSDLEFFALVLSIMSVLDKRYERVFAYLQDDINQKQFGIDLALKLYYFVEDIYQIEGFYNVGKSLQEKLTTLCFDEETMNIDDNLLKFIMSEGKKEFNRKSGLLYYPESDVQLPIKDDIAQNIVRVLRESDGTEILYFVLSGPKGIGKKTQVKRVADITDTSIVMVDVAYVVAREEKDVYRLLLIACREALLNQSSICLCNFESLFLDENKRYINLFLETAKKFSAIVFVLSDDEIKDRSIFDGYFWFDVPIEYPTKEESFTLWNLCLKEIPLSEKVEDYEVANKFSFTPGQVKGTLRETEKVAIWNQKGTITKRELYSCAYNQIVHDLKKKATLIYAKYSWDQLILAEKEKEMLKNACDQIRYKHIVYDKWGFEKRIAYGRGVSMLFAGPPGTGKTMAAQVVANELGIEMYKVDLSQIVSKYIGETEKNLNDLFNEAKKSNVILFFDETDALLGKRTEVKDSHDKNANLETSYLLQKMEEYDGITVMSTNYLENIDNAFFRRISYVIHFPFPEIKDRKKIWQTIFPKEMPISKDIDFDYLAEQFEIAGGNIKNVAITAAFLAAKSSKKLEMSHILTAIKYELTKQGKTLLKEDFGEHGYLLK